MAYKASPVVDRFMQKIQKTETCWLWHGAKQVFGYGSFFVNVRRPSASAHRVSYELFVGPIPEGMLVLHKCDVPACVNPEHLFIGTHHDNTLDMHAKRRWKYTPRDQYGENNPCSKLTNAQRAAMLAEVESGGKPLKVAKKYGISYKHLWLLRKQAAIGKDILELYPVSNPVEVVTA